MSRLILWLFCSCMLGASASAQADAPRPLSDAEAARAEVAINNVRSLPAHRLDHKLPKAALEDWLQEQAGPDARMNWVYRCDTGAGSPGQVRHPDMAEADIMLKNGQSIVVEVAVAHCDKSVEHCGRHLPSVIRIDVITGKNPTTGKFESAELDRLRDLPPFLQTLRQTSSEAQR